MKKVVESNTNNRMLIIIALVLVLILFHEPLVCLFANISSIMRKDNKCALDKTMYETKISYLEKQLSEYEKTYNDLKIYEKNSYVLAKLSLRDVYDFFDYIIINTDTLVNTGNVVVNELGFVGIVSEVSGTSAKVKLFSSKNNISVKLSSSYGLINSYDKKNNLILVKNINNYEKINIGDEVVTSGLTEITGNIKIGKVESIVLEGIEKLVYVKPYVDINNLNYLYVIKK